MLHKDIVNTHRFLKSIHHLSECTRAAYTRDIEALVGYCDQQGITCWAELDDQKLRHFVSAQHRRGLAGNSLRRSLSAIRAFYRYLIEQGQLTTNPALGILAPRSPKKLPRLLDIDQAVQLAEINDTDILAIRDRAMIELLYSSGLRLAELVALDCKQLDLTDATVTVTGKGGKSRIVPMGKYAIQALQRWLACRTDLIKDTSTAVFISRWGRRIHPRTVQKRLQYWAQRRLLNSNVHPHMLRHSFASHMLESSSELRAVQELLGHADIATTQIYTHLDFQHLAHIYDQAHPRAQKKK